MKKITLKPKSIAFGNGLNNGIPVRSVNFRGLLRCRCHRFVVFVLRRMFRLVVQFPEGRKHAHVHLAPEGRQALVDVHHGEEQLLGQVPGLPDQANFLLLNLRRATNHGYGRWIVLVGMVSTVGCWRLEWEWKGTPALLFGNQYR